MVAPRRGSYAPRMSAETAAVTTAATAFVTPLPWAEAQCAHTAELLLEQAHLEKKAAACAVQFLFRIPLGVEAHKALSALAREELVHFERTLRLLAQRGIPFGSQPPSDYAVRLKAACSSKMPERLVDELLVAGVIEARSHERMGLLATALRGRDDELADFYADLCAAEERHEGIYVQVAEQLLPAAIVAERHAALRRHEHDVLRALPFAPRLHSGLPPTTGAAVGRG